MHVVELLTTPTLRDIRGKEVPVKALLGLGFRREAAPHHTFDLESNRETWVMPIGHADPKALIQFHGDELSIKPVGTEEFLGSGPRVWPEIHEDILYRITRLFGSIQQ